MKKKYITPKSKVGCVIMDTPLLSASFDNGQKAAVDATVYSRKDSFWDDAE